MANPKNKKRRRIIVFSAIGLVLVGLTLAAVFRKRAPVITIQTEKVARRGHPSLEFIEGDALNLPFADASFDAATIAFGLRNLADPVRGLREMIRVARRAVVLEFVRPPKGIVGGAYRRYLKSVLPVVGGVISGDRAAYRYLSDTVDSYRTPDELVAMAEQAGWKGVRFVHLAFGTVGIVSGDR